MIAKSIRSMYDFSILRELRKREGLSIAEVADRSGVSTAVISRLERNQTLAELETIHRLARVFGLNPSDLIAIAENRSAHKERERRRTTDGFRFREIRYGNIRCLHAAAKAGARVSRPKVHRDDYELCWVLKGALDFRLPNERFQLKEGEAIQFDALLEHTYEAMADVEFLILHIRKEKRF
jgi:transcriptional regulator with XRE-family HTH domain